MMECCSHHSELFALVKALCVKIDERDKRDDIRHKAIEDAVHTASKDMDRRLTTLNELRAEVTMDRNVYLRRDLFDQFLRETSLWREMVSKKLSALDTRAIIWPTAIGIGLAIFTITLRFLK